MVDSPSRSARSHAAPRATMSRSPTSDRMPCASSGPLPKMTKWSGSSFSIDSRRINGCSTSGPCRTADAVLILAPLSSEGIRSRADGTRRRRPGAVPCGHAPPSISPHARMISERCSGDVPSIAELSRSVRAFWVTSVRRNAIQARRTAAPETARLRRICATGFMVISTIYFTAAPLRGLQRTVALRYRLNRRQVADNGRLAGGPDDGVLPQDLRHLLDGIHPDTRDIGQILLTEGEPGTVVGGRAEPGRAQLDHRLRELLLCTEEGLDRLAGRLGEAFVGRVQLGQRRARVLVEKLQPLVPGQVQGLHVVDREDARRPGLTADGGHLADDLATAAQPDDPGGWTGNDDLHMALKDQQGEVGLLPVPQQDAARGVLVVATHLLESRKLALRKLSVQLVVSEIVSITIGLKPLRFWRFTHVCRVYLYTFIGSRHAAGPTRAWSDTSSRQGEWTLVGSPAPAGEGGVCRGPGRTDHPRAAHGRRRPGGSRSAQGTARRATRRAVPGWPLERRSVCPEQGLAGGSPPVAGRQLIGGGAHGCSPRPWIWPGAACRRAAAVSRPRPRAAPAPRHRPVPGWRVRRPAGSLRRRRRR